MKLKCKLIVFALLIMLLFSLSSECVLADNYPERPIRWTIPFGAGGGVDRTARIFIPFLEEELGQPMILEYRPGAFSQIGNTVIYDAVPDGYSLGIFSTPPLGYTIHNYNTVYDTEDFSIFAVVTTDPVVFNVQLDSPWESLVDLIEDARKRPGEIRVGITPGYDLAPLYFENLFDIDFAIVSYDGGAAGRAAFLGGHLDVYVGGAFSALDLEDSSYALAVFDDQRNKFWPDAPVVNDILEPEYGITVPNLMAIRIFGSNARFKEEYPERWDRVYNALYNTYHNPEFIERARATGLDETLNWIDGQEAQDLVTKMHKVMEIVY